MFDSVREWNRVNIPGYVEVYIKTSVEKLRERDSKGLYSGFQKGVAYDVMGVDIKMEEPKTPDIAIENDGILTINECVDILLKGDTNVEIFNKS